MAGLNDRRRLGTDSGRIRREARAVARAGGNPTALLNLAAQTKLGEGSAIQSSEDNIAFEEKKRQMQAGLMESKRRATLGGDSRQAFDADLDRSASVKTDPAARQRAYDRGAALGVSREDIDKRAGTLQGATNASLNATRPGETAAQSQTRGGNNIGRLRDYGKTLGVAQGEKPNFNTEKLLALKGGSAPEGSRDAGPVWVSPSGTIIKKDPNDPNRYNMTPEGRVSGTLVAWEGMDKSNSLSARGIAPTRPTLQGSPKQGLIDGKPAGSVLDSMRGAETEPGNLADLKSRDAQDRAAAVTAARTESAGETSTTRKDVIDRINKERTAKGLQPFGDDIYGDMTAQEVAEGERTVRGAELSRAATNVGQAAVTPLQKSLMDARTRFAPPPEDEVQLPVRPVPTDHVQDPNAPAQGKHGVPSLLQPKSQGLGARFSSGASFTTPEAVAKRREAERQAPLLKDKQDRDKRYNAMPDLPLAAPDSLANRLYKSALTRYTR